MVLPNMYTRCSSSHTDTMRMKAALVHQALVQLCICITPEIQNIKLHVLHGHQLSCPVTRSFLRLVP